MKIEHYCYTRGAEMDYEVFSSPNNLTKSQLDIVKSKHLSILGDDVVRNLKTPKWILYKDTDFLFWGVCCENRLIASDDRMTAHKNRPIRGFFSIVITEFDREDLKMPFDINYFRELYKKEVEPYWNQRVQHQNKTTGFIAGRFDYIGAVRNDYVSLLNTDTFQCQSLGELDKDGVIAAALTLDNVSLLIDNDNIEQATNRRGAFMNCLTAKIHPGKFSIEKGPTHQSAENYNVQSKSYNEHVKRTSADGTDCLSKEVCKMVLAELENKFVIINELKNEVEKIKSRQHKQILFISIFVFIFVALLSIMSIFYWKPFYLHSKKAMVEEQNENIEKEVQPTKISAEGYTGFLIDPKYDIFSIDIKVDWVTVSSKTDADVLLDIAPNMTGGERLAEISIINNENNNEIEKVVLFQEAGK